MDKGVAEDPDNFVAATKKEMEVMNMKQTFIYKTAIDEDGFMATQCSPGYYCPTPETAIPCPVGYFCPPGSSLPRGRQITNEFP